MPNKQRCSFARVVQEPVLRTSCARVAYQTAESADVRLSIDTGLQFTKVTIIELCPIKRWPVI